MRTTAVTTTIKRRCSLALALLLSCAQARIDWNLETTFLQHLQQQANETEHEQDVAAQAAHIYPTWVSEGTCSTKCVDIRGEEEFCVATSTCEHSTWRKAFDRHKKQHSDIKSLNDFELPMSMSHCEVWGDLNRCDGTLCDEDHECQSGCCGAFVSFTHHRCLPILGDYCAGRDTTRKQTYQHAYQNGIDFDDYDVAMLEEDEHEAHIDESEEEHQKEALKQHAQNRLHDADSYDDIHDVVEELVQLQSLFQTDSNELQQNGGNKLGRPCRAEGHKDLCDEQICEFDGHCRSGCCSQVLTKGYSRCAAMLVGDYCPRALDPIHDMMEAQHEMEVIREHPEMVKRSFAEHPAELPCNVFGTVDRCDGMGCEHDGNCFSGCCSLLVTGDSKRCMPLVNGDMCPIAVDVVEPIYVVPENPDEFDSPLHFVDHKELSPAEEERAHHEDGHESDEDHPIVEKGEHHADDHHEQEYGVYEGEFHDEFHFEEPSHFIPIKSEHAIDEEESRFWDLEEDYDDAEHEIPEKREHDAKDVHEMPKDIWRSPFHGEEEGPNHHYQHPHEEEYEVEKGHNFRHHYSHEDGIDEDLLPHALTPKTPEKDDPRLKIPQGKSTAAHDHEIVTKEPIPSPEHRPHYGKAYEHERKQSLRGDSQSAGLAPKQPIKERRTQVPAHSAPHKAYKKPCSAYGTTNRCEGMMCEADADCSSQCCGQMTEGGAKMCHALIEDSFCPRAMAPAIDYSQFVDDYDHQRNDILRTQPSNEMPTYRGQDGCAVHGIEDQCDGQPCADDSDCHSGCCGHFVSFSLRRCLPLTDDSLCPRFLEPSFTSPIPMRLPPIESTIKDMYEIQDRVHQLAEVLDHDSLPLHSDVLFCRSHGAHSLCDGFMCHQGSDCRSGCCGSFGTLKSDYCQPTIDDICPVEGFVYGPMGDSQHEHAELLDTLETQPEELIKLPKALQKQDSQQDSNESFWDKCKDYMWYIVIGLAIVLVACCCCCYCCCCRGGHHTHDSHGYGGLSGGHH